MNIYTRFLKWKILSVKKDPYRSCQRPKAWKKYKSIQGIFSSYNNASIIQNKKSLEYFPFYVKFTSMHLLMYEAFQRKFEFSKMPRNIINTFPPMRKSSARSWNCPWISPHIVTGLFTGCIKQFQEFTPL